MLWPRTAAGTPARVPARATRRPPRRVNSGFVGLGYDFDLGIGIGHDFGVGNHFGLDLDLGGGLRLRFAGVTALRHAEATSATAPK